MSGFFSSFKQRTRDRDIRKIERICKEIKPNYRLVGSDWRNKNIVGQKYCNEIIYFDRIPGHSTTRILERGL